MMLPPQQQPPPRPPPSASVQATISAASTAKARVLAHHDKTVTALVPASLRVQREKAAVAPRPRGAPLQAARTELAVS